MLSISQKAFDEMAAKRRREGEVPFIVHSLRERGDPLARALPDDLLKHEVRQCLDVCNRLELTSDADRLTFCMLEITQFAGLRDLPKLGGLLDYAGGRPDARVQGLLAAMPPLVWAQLSRSAAEVRDRRGWS